MRCHANEIAWLGTKRMMKKHNGFTLIELMIVVALVAILAAVGVPSFREFIQNNRLATQANTFLTGLKLARSEAVKRGVNVVVCASNDQVQCAGTWNNGWILFVDGNGDNARATTETLIRVGAGTASPLTLTNSGNPIVYQASGIASAADKLMMCDDRGDDKARVIMIERSGNTRVSPHSGDFPTGGCP